MKTAVSLRISLIAPCGMNCALCRGYMREKNKCPGCLHEGVHKPDYCINCAIKNCSMLSEHETKYCSGCPGYPCKRIKHIDKRYRTKYGMSMVENLNMIREKGIRKFVKSEKQKWSCPACGNLICVHRGSCLICGTGRKSPEIKYPAE